MNFESFYENKYRFISNDLRSTVTFELNFFSKVFYHWYENDDQSISTGCLNLQMKFV